MKKLTIVFLLAAICAFPVFASNELTTNYQAQVITGFDPNNYDSQVNVNYHNDVAVNVHAGHNNVNVFAVSEPQYCSHNQMVVFVGAQHVSSKQVRVVVQRGIFARLRLRLNQTRVNCVQNGKIVRSTLVTGILVGNNARRVKVAVAACR